MQKINKLFKYKTNVEKQISRCTGRSSENIKNYKELLERLEYINDELDRIINE